MGDEHDLLLAGLRREERCKLIEVCEERLLVGDVGVCETVDAGVLDPAAGVAEPVERVGELLAATVHLDDADRDDAVAGVGGRRLEIADDEADAGREGGESDRSGKGAHAARPRFCTSWKRSSRSRSEE